MTEVIAVNSKVKEWALGELERVIGLEASMDSEALEIEWNVLKNLVTGYGQEYVDGARANVGLDKYPELANVVTLYSAPETMFYFKYIMMEAYEQFGDQYRLLNICNLAFTYQLRIDLPTTVWRGSNQSPRIFGNKIGYYVEGFSAYKEILNAILNIKLSMDAINTAISEYNSTVQQYKSSLPAEKRNDISTGISKLINICREVEVDKDRVESQILRWQSEIANVITARTWGWEVEAPNPDKSTKVPAGVEAGSDGSVESYEAGHDDCECDCSSCTYHECDCSNCEDQNDDPEHCNDQEYCVTANCTEYRTVGGVIRSLHPGLKSLLDQIGDSEKNETAGTHIHVYAADLEPKQIAVVLAGYAITQKVWDVIAGRNAEDDRRCRTYADVIPGHQISVTFKENALRHIGKFNAVNTYNVTSDRGTLEFRQMNCNFDFARITFFAWMARGLVEIAKRGAKVSDFVGIKDIEGIIELYAKYGFTTVKETEDIINPVGSRYNQESKRMQTA